MDERPHELPTLAKHGVKQYRYVKSEKCKMTGKREENGVTQKKEMTAEQYMTLVPASTYAIVNGKYSPQPARPLMFYPNSEVSPEFGDFTKLLKLHPTTEVSPEF